MERIENNRKLRDTLKDNSAVSLELELDIEHDTLTSVVNLIKENNP